MKKGAFPPVALAACSLYFANMALSQPQAVRYDGFYYNIEKRDYTDTSNPGGKAYIKIDTGRVFISIFFFYADGKIAFYNDEIKGKIKPDESYFSGLKEKLSSQLPRYRKYMCDWGVFTVKTDTILADEYTPEIAFTHEKIKLEMRLDKTGTIFLEKETSKYGKNNFIEFRHKADIIHNPPLVYQFKAFTIKPDSSQAWFVHRSWYRKSKAAGR